MAISTSARAMAGRPTAAVAAMYAKSRVGMPRIWFAMLSSEYRPDGTGAVAGSAGAWPAPLRPAGAQSQRQSAPAPTTSATSAARAIAPLSSVAASSARVYQRITRSSPPRRCPQKSPVSQANPRVFARDRIPRKGDRVTPGGRWRSRRPRGGSRLRAAPPRPVGCAPPLRPRCGPLPVGRSG